MRKIKSYKLFKENNNRNSNKIRFLYYLCDFDDNLLHMPTVIHMDHLVDGKWIHEDVSTEKFAQVRNDKINWRIINNNPDEAFIEFRDAGERGEDTFLDDVKIAVENGNFAPSWDKFIKCLTDGSIFAIITSRGHEPYSIRKAIEWIIDNFLTEDQKYEMYQNCLKFVYLYNVDKNYNRIPSGNFSKTPLIEDYLNCCGYYGIQSDWFVSEFGNNTPEKSKGLAVEDFIEKIDKFGKSIGWKVSVGFSDDDVKFSEHIEKLFRNELSLRYIMDYNIYDTSGREIKKTKITNESFFCKEDDDDIADRIINILKTNKNLEITYSEFTIRSQVLFGGEFSTKLTIGNSIIEIISKYDGGIGIEFGKYETFVNKIKLKCSRSKSKKIKK